MTVNEILKEKLKSVGDDVLRTYIAPDIPEKNYTMLQKLSLVELMKMRL